MNEEHVASYSEHFIIYLCISIFALTSRPIYEAFHVPKCRTSSFPYLRFFFLRYEQCAVRIQCSHIQTQSLNSTRKFSLRQLAVNVERRKVIKIKSNYMMFWDEKVDITYSLRTQTHLHENHVHEECDRRFTQTLTQI